ncbi:MAG: IclR family transcriptional regulator [Lautropia sp.]
MLLLRRIAMRGPAGCGLTDLAQRSDLDKGTTHRILSALVRGRLVERDPVTRAYRLGAMLFELSLGRPDLLEMRKASEQPLERVAQRLRCMTYLYLRSGNDVVWAAEAGRAPIKAMMGRIGSRRPIVHTAGGAAMLLAMPPQQAAAIIADCLEELRAPGGVGRLDAASQILERSRSLGFGVSEGHIAPHTTVIAVAVRDAAGKPFAAVNAGGPTGDFPIARYRAVVEVLSQEALAIEELVAQISPRST